MAATPDPTSSLLDDALADTDRQIAETERRRERQVRLLRELDPGTRAQINAERRLREIEWTLSLNQMHRILVQHLLAPDLSNGLGYP